MNSLFLILAQIAYELSPERMALLAEKLSNLTHASEVGMLKKAWGPNIDKTLFNSFIEELAKYPDMTGKELSMAFRSAAATIQLGESKGCQELLWTGPPTSSVALRQTEQAICELIHGAQKTLFLVSFIVYKADIVLDALAEAMQRNVDINILLDISPKQGIADNYASISNMRAKLPTAKFYIWDKKHNPDGASVHAKCAVADRTTALITSANLTGKAMNSNMELGIYIKNGHIPLQLSSLLEALVTEKTITLHNNSRN